MFFFVFCCYFCFCSSCFCNVINSMRNAVIVTFIFECISFILFYLSLSHIGRGGSVFATRKTIFNIGKGKKKKKNGF